METWYSIQTSAFRSPVFRSVSPTINKNSNLNSSSLKLTRVNDIKKIEKVSEGEGD